MNVHPCIMGSHTIKGADTVYTVKIPSKTGVSNHWNGIWIGTVEWKMEWNDECT